MGALGSVVGTCFMASDIAIQTLYREWLQLRLTIRNFVLSGRTDNFGHKRSLENNLWQLSVRRLASAKESFYVANAVWQVLA